MTLPYDIARCGGRIDNVSTGRAGCVDITISAGHVECVRCQRRKASDPDPSAPNRPIPYITPPQFVAGRCHERIAP